MKKVLYYLPLALVCGVLVYFLYALGSRFSDFWPIFLAQLGVIAVILASAILLDRGHWFACAPEIALGIWFIWLGFNNQSPVIDEKLIGFALVAYYAVCGIAAWKSRKHN